MILRRELVRRGDHTLWEVQLIGVSGQVCSRSYELDGPQKRLFARLAEAEAALLEVGEKAAA